MASACLCLALGLTAQEEEAGTSSPAEFCGAEVSGRAGPGLAQGAAGQGPLGEAWGGLQCERSGAVALWGRLSPLCVLQPQPLGWTRAAGTAWLLLRVWLR